MVTENTDKMMVWLDLETTGLDRDTDYILEAGLIVTDIYGNHLGKQNWVVGMGSGYTDHGYDRTLRINEVINAFEKGDGADDYFVSSMHKDNNLWIEVSASPLTEYETQYEMIDWLLTFGINRATQPLCGSTISFDRGMIERWMPEFNEFLHYRNIDITTLKNIALLRAPSVAAEWKSIMGDSPKEHRALDDIAGTIEEYKFYIDSGFIRVD